MTQGVFETQSQDQGQGTTTDIPTVYIGEGKKYKTVEEADKAFGHLNSHVEKIQRENAEMRAKLEKAKTVEEVLETIKQQSTHVQWGQQETKTNSDAGKQEIDFNAVIEGKLSEWETQRSRQNNLQAVNKALTDQFGEKAAEVFTAKSKELGIDLNQLAAVSPKAVLEYFPKQQAPRADSSTGTINTSYYDNNQPKINTKSYWNEQFKTGKITREEKFRREHESLEKLGWEAFNK